MSAGPYIFSDDRGTQVASRSRIGDAYDRAQGRMTLAERLELDAREQRAIDEEAAR